MPFRQFDPARRALLLRSAGAAGFAALTFVAGESTAAAAKAAKSDFMYQDHRQNGKSCGQCKFFLGDGPKPDIGSCSIVSGTISREGWCTAFTPKVLA
jgi:hypothetical protein